MLLRPLQSLCPGIITDHDLQGNAGQLSGFHLIDNCLQIGAAARYQYAYS